MVALQTAWRTWTKLVEASQQHYSPKTVLAVPKYHVNTIWHYLLHFLWVLGGSNQVVAVWGSKGEQLWSSRSSDDNRGPLGTFHFFLMIFLFSILHLKGYIHLLLAREKKIFYTSWIMQTFTYEWPLSILFCHIIHLLWWGIITRKTQKTNLMLQCILLNKPTKQKMILK